MPDLGAFERQIVHQSFLIEDEPDHRTTDAVGVDLPAGTTAPQTAPERDPIPYALETDWPVEAAGFQPVPLMHISRPVEICAEAHASRSALVMRQ